MQAAEAPASAGQKGAVVLQIPWCLPVSRLCSAWGASTCSFSMMGEFFSLILNGLAFWKRTNLHQYNNKNIHPSMHAVHIFYFICAWHCFQCMLHHCKADWHKFCLRQMWVWLKATKKWEWGWEICYLDYLKATWFCLVNKGDSFHTCDFVSKNNRQKWE